MQSNFPKLLAGTLLATMALCQPVSAQKIVDYGQLLLDAQQDLDIAWHALGKAYDHSRQPEALAARAPLAERITNAEIMFLLNSYTEASLLFSDLLPAVRQADPSSLPKVLYYLAESNYQIKNLALAQKYFAELIELKDGRYAINSLKRLIQIGDALGELGYVDRYANMLTQISGHDIPLEVAYAYAKSLIRQNQPQKVISILEKMDLSSMEGVKADYFMAVALVMDKQYERAIGRFRGVAKKAQTWADNSKLAAEEKSDLQEIADLCSLSIGRIFYELGDFSAAIDAYQNISYQSRQFEQMLYDITWTYVRLAQQCGDNADEREANYRRALSMLDLLLGSESNTALAAEARLLEGNLFLRINDEEQAYEKFAGVVDRYSKIVKNINEITKGYESPQKYFEAILATRQRGGLGWENIMPEEVALWAGEDKNIAVAIDTLHEVDRTRKWIEESLQLMDTMLASVETDNRLQFLPELAEMQKQQAQMKGSFISLSQRLANLQNELVGGQPDSDVRRKLLKAREERIRLEADYQKIPQDANSYQRRKDEITAAIDKTEKAAFRLGAEVSSLVQQLDAMEKWYNSDRDQFNLTADQEQAFKTQVMGERRVIQELETAQKQLYAQMDKDRTIIKILNEEEQRDQLVRQRYMQAVNNESTLLKKANSEMLAGKHAKDAYQIIENRLSSLEKDSKEWQAAYRRLVIMTAQAQYRLEQGGADVAILEKEIAEERQWINPGNVALMSLEPEQVAYLHELDGLSALVAALGDMQTAQNEDYQALKAMVERVGNKELSDKALQAALVNNVLPESALINEQSPALLTDNITLTGNRIAVALKRLDVYMARVRIMVSRQTKNIREEILAQKQVFLEYQKDLDNLEQGGTAVLSEVSSKAFEEVAHRFDSIVLRADVGLLDLAWTQKENRTRKITGKVDERNVAIEALRQEFGELSVEEE